MHQAIGAKGKIIGIEQSPEMIAKARARIEQNHLGKITLVNSPVETARRPLSGRLVVVAADCNAALDETAVAVGSERAGGIYVTCVCAYVVNRGDWPRSTQEHHHGYVQAKHFVAASTHG